MLENIYEAVIFILASKNQIFTEGYDVYIFKVVGRLK